METTVLTMCAILHEYNLMRFIVILQVMVVEQEEAKDFVENE